MSVKWGRIRPALQARLPRQRGYPARLSPIRAVSIA